MKQSTLHFLFFSPWNKGPACRRGEGVLPPSVHNDSLWPRGEDTCGVSGSLSCNLIHHHHHCGCSAARWLPRRGRSSRSSFHDTPPLPPDRFSSKRGAIARCPHLSLQCAGVHAECHCTSQNTPAPPSYRPEKHCHNLLMAFFFYEHEVHPG